jgi:hypothetical protein
VYGTGGPLPIRVRGIDRDKFSFTFRFRGILTYPRNISVTRQADVCAVHCDRCVHGGNQVRVIRNVRVLGWFMAAAEMALAEQSGWLGGSLVGMVM